MAAARHLRQVATLLVVLLGSAVAAALTPADRQILSRRIELVKAVRPLKAIVMSEHYLVPRQRLRMNIKHNAPILPLLKELHQCQGSLAMLGIDHNATAALGRHR